MQEQKNPVLDVLGWSGTIKLEVFDKPGGKLVSVVEEEMHSFVRNFFNLQVMSAMCFAAPNGTVGDADLSLARKGGVVVNQTTKMPVIAVRGNVVTDGYIAAAGDDTVGIIIGTSATVFSFDDNDLVTQILDGVGAGQMSHIESNLGVLTWSVGTRKFTNELIRFFNNNSGGPITVRESGIVTEAGFWLSGGSDSTEDLLMARDVIGSPPAVADTGQLKVTYNLVSPAFPS